MVQPIVLPCQYILDISSFASADSWNLTTCLRQ